MNKKLLIITLFVIQSLQLLAQPGCQDPQATNYNPSATSTDGSCTYSTTNATLTNRVAGLPAALAETSSLLITDGRVFTNNDSGNEPKIYQIDSASGVILKTTTIKGYTNIDWEDLAADSTYIYIGDFGNNDGERTNLRVLKIRKSSVYNPDSLQVGAESIRFSYPDQTSFAPSSTHNFDCEAFFYHKGALHLFSKNRGNKKTKHYTITTNPGTQVAVLKDSLNTNGLVTSASIRRDGKVAMLLGYDTGTLQVFSWLLFGFDSTNYFSANKRRLELPGFLSSGQTEGIGFADNYRLWISNETYTNGPFSIPAKVKQMNIKQYIDQTITDISPQNEASIRIFPNPASSFFELRSATGGNLEVYGILGNLIANLNLENGNHKISTSILPSGMVWLRFTERGTTKTTTRKLLISK